MIPLQTYMSLQRTQINDFAMQLESDFQKIGFHSKVCSLTSKEEAVTQILLLEATLHNENDNAVFVANEVKKSFKAATGVAIQ